MVADMEVAEKVAHMVAQMEVADIVAHMVDIWSEWWGDMTCPTKTFREYPYRAIPIPICLESSLLKGL